jgi:sialate O-acetylesterase
MSKNRILGIIITLLAFISLGRSQSPDLKPLLDLSGHWKFELGDNARWSDPAFDDSKWDRIYVPSPWEDEGYPGYDGFAWYRKHFRGDDDFRDMSLYLRLGYIDDVSEVFLNGHMIAYQGVFPPNYMTGYAVALECLIPKEYVRYGSDNVIAVRVYDHQQAGGITHGDVGIYERRNFLEPDFDLSGRWKFKTGDDKSWAESAFDDSQWQQLKVPLLWDVQGYKDYDGFAWYRVTFRVPADLANHRLILLLGRIDDMDEAYLNGELIGRTGRMRRGLSSNDIRGEWQQQRAYSIPTSLLKPNEENTLAVRVLDVWLHGGIYDGPIGLIQRDRYLGWKDRPRSVWDVFRQLFR